MDNILKGILLGTGVLLTCIIISIGFMVAKQSMKISSANSKELDEISSELSERDLVMYDGLEVKGSDVINCIKKQLGSYTNTETAPVSVNVITSNTNYTYVNGASIEAINNFANDKYINPLKKFIGKAVRDKNKVIICLRFTQI